MYIIKTIENQQDAFAPRYAVVGAESGVVVRMFEVRRNAFDFMEHLNKWEV